MFEGTVIVFLFQKNTTNINLSATSSIWPYIYCVVALFKAHFPLFYQIDFSRKSSLPNILMAKQFTICNLLVHLWSEAPKVTQVWQEGRSLSTPMVDGGLMGEVLSLGRTSLRFVSLISFPSETVHWVSASKISFILPLRLLKILKYFSHNHQNMFM